MTLLDTLIGTERYHLVVTSYSPHQGHADKVICVSVLNRDNGHTAWQMISATQWNDLRPEQHALYYDNGRQVIRYMDDVCSGRPDITRGHLCSITETELRAFQEAMSWPSPSSP